MPMTLEEITKEAKELSFDERELLMYSLSHDLPPEEAERIEQLWIEEIKRRDKMREAGMISARPVEEAIADIEARLDAKYSH